MSRASTFDRRNLDREVERINHNVVLLNGSPILSNILQEIKGDGKVNEVNVTLYVDPEYDEHFGEKFKGFFDQLETPVNVSLQHHFEIQNGGLRKLESKGKLTVLLVSEKANPEALLDYLEAVGDAYIFTDQRRFVSGVLRKRRLQVQPTIIELKEGAEDEITLANLNTVIQASDLNQLRSNLNILSEALKDEQKLIRAKSILNKKDSLALQMKNVKEAKDELSDIKADVNRQFKAISNELDHQLEIAKSNKSNLSKHLKKIKSYEGFDVEESGKQQKISFPSGFLTNMNGDVMQDIEMEFQKQSKLLVNTVKSINADVKEKLNDLNINYPIIRQDENLDNQIEQVIGISHFEPKNTDKTVSKKGWYSLFMELRTPLFMMMPIMMIVMIFSQASSKADIGQIDESITFDNDNKRECIVIEKFPKAIGGEDNFNEAANAFMRTLSSTINQRDDSKNPFLINEKLIIAHREVESGTQYKKKKTYVPETSIINNKLYLYVLQDRGIVVDELLNPNNSLLAFSNRRRSGGMGYGAIINGINRIPPEYKSLFSFALFSLVFFYIRSRFKSFQKEKEDQSVKEKLSLRQTLEQDLSRFIDTTFSKWQNRMNQYMKTNQDKINHKLEDLVDNHVDKEITKHTLDKQLFDSRNKSLSDDEKSATKIVGDIRNLQMSLRDANRDIAKAIN